MDAVIELRYVLDTLLLLASSALIMWMAAGFTMLEAGLLAMTIRRISTSTTYACT